MLAKVKAAASGIREYLEFGRKKGREYDRDLIDERIPLAGDIDLMDDTINQIQTRQKGDSRYLHITLSFAERYTESDSPAVGQINLETIRAVTEQYRLDLMAAYETEEYVFYAEAHIPKVTHDIHATTGEAYERLPHIHIVIPKRNISNDTYLDPLGYGKENLAFHDAIQEKINNDFSLKSPYDTPRDEPIPFPLGRHKADPEKLSAKEVRAYIRQEAIKAGARSLDDIACIAEQYGAVRVRHGRQGDYLNVKPNWADKGINLKDITPESLQSITAGVAADIPRPSADVTAKKVEQWKQQRALEVRYLSSKGKWAAYKQLDKQGKKEWLTEKQLQSRAALLRILNRGLYEHRGRINGQNGSIKPDDGNYDRTEPSYHTRADSDYKIITKGTRDSRQPGHTNRTDQSTFETDQRRDSRDPEKFRIEKGTDDGTTSISGAVQTMREREVKCRQALAQSAKTLKSNRTVTLDVKPAQLSFGRLRAVLERETIRASDPIKNAERQKSVAAAMVRRNHSLITAKQLKNETNPTLVIEAAARQFKINQANYSIGIGADGTPRIIHNGKQYNLGDFFTKHLKQSWNDTQKILTQCYQASLSDALPTPDFAMWNAFNKWRMLQYKQRQTERENTKIRLREETLAVRNLYKEQKQAAHKLKGIARRGAMAEARATRAIALERIVQKRQAVYENLKSPGRNAEYRTFLHGLAEHGDLIALNELRRMQPAMSNEGEKNYVRGKDQGKATFPLPSYRVDTIGNVIYQDQGKTVIKDAKHGIEILNTTQRTYDLALKIAVSRYGKSLTLNGDAVFKQQMIEAARRSGLNFEIKDASNPLASPIRINAPIRKR